MVQEFDVMHEALRNVNQEERRLREYISDEWMALDATNEEANVAKAAAVATQAELASKLDPTFFGIHSI